MNEFCQKIADILDAESVSESDVLGEFDEWDSLSILSIIAMLDSNHGVNLTAADLNGARTVGDLWQLVQSKKQS
ncbi:MAG: acyl carrier protein [Verrucomicrobiota bacterium]